MTLAQPAFQATGDEDWLKRTDFAVTFLDRYGNEIGRRGVKHDETVPFDELPEFFVKEVLSTEDRRFFHHFGIDVVGTLRALTVNAHAGGVVQGGSSITQQLAKNVFLSNERSISRKITEAYLALWIEHHLTKKEILGLYLDRVYMGGGTFGVEAAARHYFGKSIRDVNLAEGAMLAGLFKAPTKFSPGVNLPAARARANDVLSNLVDAGFMTEAQVYSARRNPATPVERAEDTSPDWYLDFAFNEIKQLAAAGKIGVDRVLTVRTGLDQDIQQKAEAVVEDKLRVDAPAYNAHQAAAVVADPDGLVRAVVGGRDYGASQFNRATDALRQPGSSFKVLVYLTALLTNKFHPDIGGRRLGDLHRRLLRPQLPQRARRPDADVSRAGVVLQHRGDLAVAGRSARPIGRRQVLPPGADGGARPLQDRRHRAPDGHNDAVPRHGVAAGRRRRGQDDRHGRRQRDARQRRPSRAGRTRRPKSAIRRAR